MPGVVTLLSFSEDEKATLIGDKDRKAIAQKAGKLVGQLVSDLFTETKDLAAQHPSNSELEVVDGHLQQVTEILSVLPENETTEELRVTVVQLKELVDSSRTMFNGAVG